MITHEKFKGSDCDALEEFMGVRRSGVRVRPLPGSAPLLVDVHMAQIGSMNVWRSRYGRGIATVASSASDTLMLLAPYRGGVDAPGVIPEPVNQDRFVTLWADQIERLDFLEGTMQHGMLVPMSQVSDRLAQRLDRAVTKPLRFAASHDTADGAAASVPMVLAGLMSAVLNPLSARDGTALKGASATLIDLILEVIPHTFSEALHAPAPRIAPRQVRRAIAYIHDSPMPVLSVDELAAICNVSSRSLQYAFRDFVGASPSEYWRRVRRDKAIEQLRRQPSASILEVSAAWGFTNVTRFRELCAQAGADDIARKTYRSLAFGTAS